MKKKVIIFLLAFLTISNLSLAGTIQLPKTGQTSCYDSRGKSISCAGTGHDGDHQMGVAWPTLRFADNGDGTVTDNLTGLIWLKDANCLKTNYPRIDVDGTAGDGKVTWQSALNFVADINSGKYSKCGFGYTDWVLPNINELESLSNLDQANLATWLITQGFTNIHSDNYWTGTTYAYSTNAAWYIKMKYGEMMPFGKVGNLYVWPVRGTSTKPAQVWKTGQLISYADGDDGDLQRGVAWPSPRFKDNGNGTLTDNLTGLIWLKNAHCVERFYGITWANALLEVGSLNNAGAMYGNSCGDTSNGGSHQNDWRLPNRKELFSLIDHSRHSPVLPEGHPFTNIQWANGGYWSGSTYGGSKNYAWEISTWNGEVSATRKSFGGYVLPVRSGLPAISVIPDIKANGQDGPIIISTPVSFSVTVSLNANGNTNNADWWAVVQKPDGSWEYYDLPSKTFRPGMTFTHQGPLFDLSSYNVLTTSRLPQGTYTYYFGVDMTVDGTVTVGNLFHDSVKVNVTPGARPKSTLPDTGQKGCYDDTTSITCPSPGQAFYGQDANYSINPPSFTYNGDRTVTDNITGLMWQQKDDGNRYNWYEANGVTDSTYNPGGVTNVCGSLTLGSYSDWRVPDISELVSIFNLGGYKPAFDTMVFPNTNPFDIWLRYWSSTSFSYNNTDAWDVFYAGNVENRPKSNQYYVRCVRGSQKTNNFADNGNGTVTDSKTGLTWQQGEPGRMNWENALSYCEGLSLAGFSDWRLPNFKELQSIVDYGKNYPAADTKYFPNVVVPYYWTSTSDVVSENAAWLVSFSFGDVEPDNSKTHTTMSTRCVRGP